MVRIFCTIIPSFQVIPAFFFSKYIVFRKGSVSNKPFRRLFYETGDLFPNYAANLGAGQNLYNFSYYGFLSPVVLASFLLPFVKMPVYNMATGLISLLATCLLFYRWLKAKGFSDFISVTASMIFLLAAPMFNR